MIRRPQSSTRTATLFPDTTRCRSSGGQRRLGNRRDAVRLRCQQEGADIRAAIDRAIHAQFAPRGHDRDMRRVEQDEIAGRLRARRSEEHTSELQSLMRISYAVFCLKKTKTTAHHKRTTTNKI